MASWQDGAEYAPLERPDGFAVPQAQPLTAAPAVASPASGQPELPPDSYSPADQARDLAALAATPAPSRDPHTPFATNAVAVESAWEAAHGSVATQRPPGWPQSPTSPPTRPVVAAPQPYRRLYSQPDQPDAARPTPTAGAVTTAPGGVPASLGRPATAAFPPPTGAPAFPTASGTPVPTGSRGPQSPAHQLAPSPWQPGQPPASGWGGAPSPWQQAGPQKPTGLAAWATPVKIALPAMLLIGGLWTAGSTVLMLLSLVLVLLVDLGRPRLRRAFISVVPGAVVMGVGLTQLGADWWDALGLAARLACWVMLGLDVFLVDRTTPRR